MTKNAIHELGHAYYYAIGPQTLNGLSRNALIPNSPDSNLDWQQHPAWMNGGQDMGGELFAEPFITWTLNGWNGNPKFENFVSDAMNTMNGFVP